MADHEIDRAPLRSPSHPRSRARQPPVSQLAANFQPSAIDLDRDPLTGELIPGSQFALPKQVQSVASQLQQPFPALVGDSTEALTSSSTPSRANSRWAKEIDGHSATWRATRLCSAGETPLPNPNCANVTFSPTGGAESLPKRFFFGEQ